MCRFMASTLATFDEARNVSCSHTCVESVAVLISLLTVAGGVVVTCGCAARRIVFLLCGFVGVPLGLTLDLNGIAGPLLWFLSGTVAAACTACDDEFQLRSSAAGRREAS
jgi:hypothetical protein